MIEFDRFQLNNGLKVIVHKDTSTAIVAVNLLYDVGARDETPDKTGFAHLFEHLMFGGSINIPVYDEPLQMVGGENNAFTSNDMTNYYLTLPKNNIETAFWLESDRMLSLAFTEKSLEVQKNVVIEEFKQRYLNQPYGDVFLLLRPLAYKIHPYNWPTIGKEISHIENATMEDVKGFFKKFYAPNNAILVVAGDVDTQQVKELAEKWFGEIPRGPEFIRQLPKEPEKLEPEYLTVEKDVPFDALYMAYHICARKAKQYYTADLISDILSRGNSSRFHLELVKKKKIFSEINAYVTGDFDEGLFIISGKVVEGFSIKQAEQAVFEEIEKLKLELVEQNELDKVKNKVESSLAFSELSVSNKAMTLAYYELLGDAEMINQEIGKYMLVSPLEIKKLANEIFKGQNCSTLYYLSKK
ncbi:MAG: insulinase family protein [Bacteroidetes bacterium]|nr:insulinase family protein [Bacteroidota bacterium]HET6243373.1 pitrilysin family protein [Bacteroidia bacterium]